LPLLRRLQMVDLKSTVYALQNTLALQSGEDIFIYFSNEKPIHASIWAKNNNFPLDILNAGSPQNDLWDGDNSVVQLITDMEITGFSIHLIPREVGDETGFVSLHQDFKLVIRS